MKTALPPILDVEPMAPPVSVAGDVHLNPDQPEVTEMFLGYLDGIAGGGGTLVLLGDLFDYWSGRPQAKEPFARPILERLADVARSGVRLTFVPGNRDFELASAGGIGFPLHIWPDVVRTTWGDKRVVLTHGDLLCTADTAYQRMRSVLRRKNGRSRLWWRLAPHKVIRYFARGIRATSMRETRRKRPLSMGIDYGAARDWLDAYEADVLVAGHVHTGLHHKLPGTNGRGERDVYVLKDWERGGGVVTFDERGIRLESP